MNALVQRAARGSLIASTLSFLALTLAVTDVGRKALDPSLRHSRAVAKSITSENQQTIVNYDVLRRSITYGTASLFDVRQALTQDNEMGLSNTIHALYGMRVQRGVVHVLYGMWKGDREAYPEFSWDLIEKPSVKIAIASTLNRIQIVDTDEFKNYIRAQQNADDSFIRAQASIAFGLGGDPSDLDYLYTQADGEDHYVAQSAITALSLYGGDQARDFMIELLKKHQGTSRGALIAELLRKAYQWPPQELNPLS